MKQFQFLIDQIFQNFLNFKFYFPQIFQIYFKEFQLILRNYSPSLKESFFLFLKIIFGPKELIKKLSIACCLQATVFTIQQFESLFQLLIRLCYSKGRQILLLEKQLKQVKTYEEWKIVAEKLDQLRGYDKWREKDQSDLYDYKVLKKRIRDIRWMMNNHDIFNLMFRLRGGLARDMCGIQHEGLFTRALAGTKYLIEEYHKTICEALNYICDTESDEVPTDAKLAFFNETRHAYGRTALLLSGGAALGYYHSGLAEELLKSGVLPRVASGASAGSLLVSMMGTRTDDELMALATQYYRKDYLMFEWQSLPRSPGKERFRNFFPSFLQVVADFIYGVFIEGKSPQKLDSKHLREVVIENTGLDTFQEAFDRTGRIINITVAPVNDFDPPRLLNYLTAPHVCIYSAALASCAIPGVFDNVPLMIKEANGEIKPENEWTVGGPGSEGDELHPHHHHYSDGSVENDLPMKQLSELFNINHFIVSQVNAHSAIFSTVTMESNVWHPPLYGLFVDLLKYTKAQARNWVKAVTDFLIFGAISSSWGAKRGVSLLLTQEYGGRECDITIMPWRGHLNMITSWLVFLMNPTEEEYRDIVHVGKTNTWPYLSRVKAHCQIEVTLDSCVQKLRKKVAIENYRHLTNDSKVKEIVHKPLSNQHLQRSPSFYTSRSIVNLSGLSVSDPQPLTYAELMKEGIQLPSPSHSSNHIHNLANSQFVKDSTQLSPTSLKPPSQWVVSTPEYQESVKDEFTRINRVNSGPVFTKEMLTDLKNFSEENL